MPGIINRDHRIFLQDFSQPFTDIECAPRHNCTSILNPPRPTLTAQEATVLRFRRRCFRGLNCEFEHDIVVELERSDDRWLVWCIGLNAYRAFTVVYPIFIHFSRILEHTLRWYTTISPDKVYIRMHDPGPSQETESLVKRLAGPSTGKAGLSKDQTEINRIIAEASKGSKFYENEKKKDKDLTKRIDLLLKQRDDALKNTNIQTLEQSADRLIAHIECQRDLSQIIVHIDMDAFFANVELLDNPDLQGKPFGVGHGVLTTASYEARKYGVRSGMPGFIAKKLCPQLIFVKNHFSRYIEMSKAIMSVLRRYDPNLLPGGCDEAYLNITAYCQSNNLTAAECVQNMRLVVFEETKLTASAGIAPTKMLAKICSDKNKPNGQFEMPFNRQSVASFLRDLSIRKVPGIGRVNERLLESIGVKTCGDIFTHRGTIYLMQKQLGKQYLFRTYLGVTSNTVEPMARDERRSIGAERTFSPIGDKERILHKLDEVAIELEKDMDRSAWSGRTVTLKYKLDTYQVFTRSKSLNRWIRKKEDLYSIGVELLLPELPLTIRLIGLRVTKLKDLRGPSEPTNGIKRFFGPVQNARPRKKSKQEQIEDDEEDIEGDQVDDNDDDDEATPGFHEDDEANGDLIPDFDGGIVEGTDEPQSPISAPVSSTRSPGLTNLKHPTTTLSDSGPQGFRAKPRSVGNVARPITSFSIATDKTSQIDEEAYDCPLCGRTIQTDNQGFNSHIDSCLSRDAIRQAHAEATASSITQISRTNKNKNVPS